MAVAAQRGDYRSASSASRGRCRSCTAWRAASIIGKGGDIAEGLAGIYREARRLVMLGGRENDPQHILRARAMLHEIASAWSQIGNAAPPM